MTDAKKRRDELLAEWADCGDGFEEGQMLKRLVDEIDGLERLVARAEAWKRAAEAFANHEYLCQFGDECEGEEEEHERTRAFALIKEARALDPAEPEGDQ